MRDQPPCSVPPRQAITASIPRLLNHCQTTAALSLLLLLLHHHVCTVLTAPQNKVIFNYFPYPWFVSTVHVVVGTLYCGLAYLLGAKKASFERVGDDRSCCSLKGRLQSLAGCVSSQPEGAGQLLRGRLQRRACTRSWRFPLCSAFAHLPIPFFPLLLQPITKDELSAIAGPAAMHAVGHVAANLSFAAVAISLTHTVKTLEPAFNVVLSKVWGGEVAWCGCCPPVACRGTCLLLSVVAAY